MPPVQLEVLKDEVQLEQAQAQGENRVVEGKSEIQYLGALRTDNLDPGQYLILSAVPGRDDARQPYVEAAFTLVKK